MAFTDTPDSSSKQASTSRGVHIPSPRPQKSKKLPTRPAIKSVHSASNKNKRVSIEDPGSQDTWECEGMAASFPQFCTMCEHQIIVPNNSVLYCSEHCRRRDMNKPLTACLPSNAYPYSRPATPTQPCHMMDYLSPRSSRDIIPQLSPTMSRNMSCGDLSTDASSDSEDDDNLSDQESRPSGHRRHTSEAERYLRHFQSSSFQTELAARHTSRPRSQARASVMSTAPSLTHSPSPEMSPLSATALASLPVLLPYLRPLPSRVNPFSSTFGAKSITLVTPSAPEQSIPRTTSHASLPGFKAQPSISTDVGANDLPDSLPVEELRYERLSYANSLPRQNGSDLQSLFRFAEMQAPACSPRAVRQDMWRDVNMSQES